MPDKKQPRKNELKMAREGKTVRILVQGVIGWDYWGTTALRFREDLKSNAPGANTLEMEIDSPGGIITEGIAMANAVMEQDATIHTYVSGEAASMGSVLLMAGDKMFIPANAMVMVHKPLDDIAGNADDLRKHANVLDKFEKAMMSMYMRHFKGTEEEMAALMSSETYLTADDMEAKFNNVVVMRAELSAVACSDPISIWKPEAEKAEQEREVVIEDASFLAFLKRKFGAEAKAPHTETNQQEKAMTPEEKAEMEKAIASKVTESVVAALKKDANPAPKEPPAPQAVKVPEGLNTSDPEALEAHAKKLENEKALAAVDWNDPVSVRAFREITTGKKPSGQVPMGNADPATGQNPVEAQNKQDTRAAMGLSK